LIVFACLGFITTSTRYSASFNSFDCILTAVNENLYGVPVYVYFQFF